MTVRAGREFLAIPGPTTIPDEVLRAMHRGPLDIYSSEMFDLTDGLLRDLSRLFATQGRSYMYIANGHGAWEAVLSNILSRDDKVLVLNIIITARSAQKASDLANAIANAYLADQADARRDKAAKASEAA